MEIELIQNPINQLLIFIAFWLINCLIKWRNSKYIVGSGFKALLCWLVVGSLIGVAQSFMWSYYLHLMGALFAGYCIYIVSVIIADKWGYPYMHDDGLIVLVPVFLSPFIILPALLIKLLVSLFAIYS